VRQRLAQGRRRSQSNGDDAFADGRLKRRRPTSADFWVQALKTIVVERVNHSANVRLIGLTDQRDLIVRCVHHRRQQNLRTLAERLAARLSKVRQELHLTLFQRSDEQRRAGLFKVNWYVQHRQLE
jgi:hypothetical protein